MRSNSLTTTGSASVMMMIFPARTTLSASDFEPVSSITPAEKSVTYPMPMILTSREKIRLSMPARCISVSNTVKMPTTLSSTISRMMTPPASVTAIAISARVSRRMSAHTAVITPAAAIFTMSISTARISS